MALQLSTSPKKVIMHSWKKNTFQREFSSKENGVTMLEEYKGPAYAVQTELPEERTA